GCAVGGVSAATGVSLVLAADEPPLATWTDGDGVAHSLWLVDDDERQRAIADAVASAPVVIADGHHRYETALAYRDEVRATNGDTAGPHDFVMCLVVELTEAELDVAPIHRLVRGLPDGVDTDAALEPYFTREPLELDGSVVPPLVERGALGLVTADGVTALVPRPDAFTGVHDLDTVRLDHVLATFPEHSLVFQHGVANVVDQV